MVKYNGDRGRLLSPSPRGWRGGGGGGGKEGGGEGGGRIRGGGGGGRIRGEKMGKGRLETKGRLEYV